ncbi:hypothetical protein [Azospirillum sp.]|uniref:hypothetical protein n=1 Tax=Azospirillum sp. TaxID=34012 RepID=UPI002D3AF83A|nr:hypothetical protein [Azospirillum sp.]HYD67615.1 hypothetical protein [Azospirillum sp.]
MTDATIDPALSTDETQAGVYNTVFERLVRSPDDVVGLVAYGIYKQGKRDWLARYRRKHGRAPDDRALEAYHDHISDTDLERLRNDAERMMLAFAEVIVEDRAPEIQRQAQIRNLTDIEDRILKRIDERTRFSDSLKANLTAWLISLVVIITVVLVINYRAVWAAFKQAIGIS